MGKGVAKHWLGYVIAAIIVIILLAVYITGTHKIFVKKILDTIDVVIKIREVSP